MKYFEGKDEDGYKTYWQLEEESWCEHCGDLEQFDLIFHNHTSWCVACAHANGDLDKLTREQFWGLLQVQSRKKIAYFGNLVKAIVGREKDIELEVKFWKGE